MIKSWDNIYPYQDPPESIPLAFPGFGKEFYLEGEISRLNNSIHYYLECVYIMVVEKGFRLVALHQNRTAFDKIFKSLKGAKIIFGKLFKEKSWGKNVTPEWSPFYDPDKYWIDEKNQIILSAHSSLTTPPFTKPALKAHSNIW